MCCGMCCSMSCGVCCGMCCGMCCGKDDEATKAQRTRRGTKKLILDYYNYYYKKILVGGKFEEEIVRSQ